MAKNRQSENIIVDILPTTFLPLTAKKVQNPLKIDKKSIFPIEHLF